MPAATVLIIGASRGLGLELVRNLNSRGSNVFATVRSTPKTGTFPVGVNVIEGVDIGEEDAGAKIVCGLGGTKVDLTIVNAGVFKAEVRCFLVAHYPLLKGMADFGYAQLRRRS